jgi:hypothetical protein
MKNLICLLILFSGNNLLCQSNYYPLEKDSIPLIASKDSYRIIGTLNDEPRPITLDFLIKVEENREDQGFVKIWIDEIFVEIFPKQY